MKTLDFDIEEVDRCFREKKIMDLRGIGNRLIREACLRNDYAKAELGVIAYALHKIETKSHFVKSPQWGIISREISQYLGEGAIASREGNDRKLMDSLKQMIRGIRQIDDELGNFAQNIYDKAKVKMGSQAYSYGLSIAQSAALAGADPKELQAYIGFTTMHDEETEVKTIEERVKELRGLIEA